MKSTCILLVTLFISHITIAQEIQFNWVNAITGLNGEYSLGTVIDDAGNIYTVGYFDGKTDFDPGPDSFLIEPLGTSDAFVRKLDPQGNFIWAISMGGTEYTRAYDITIDKQGNLLVVGMFKDWADFDPSSAFYNLQSNGDSDAFIQKLDPNGQLIWVKSVTSVDWVNLFDIKVNSNNDILGFGTFSGTTDFDPGSNSHTIKSNQYVNTFIIKLDANGVFNWVKNVDGWSYSKKMVVDSNDNIYSTGYFLFTADLDPDTSTYNLTSVGRYDVYIQKLDPDGNLLWAHSFGSNPDHEIGNDIAIDVSNNCYVTGKFTNTVDFDPDTGVDNRTSVGNNDVFIMKLNEDGKIQWVNTFGGISSDIGRQLAIDKYNNIFLAGTFNQTVDFDSGIDSLPLTSNGSNDIFLQKLDSNGHLLWVKTLGGSGSDGVNSMLLDQLGNLYLSGPFRDTVNFDIDTGITNMYSSGVQFDAYLVKYSHCGYFELNTTLEQNGVTLSSPTTEFEYQWLKCDSGFQPLIGYILRQMTATENGKYALEITHSGICKDTSACMEIVSVGIGSNDRNDLTHIHVFPNPNNGLVNIKLDEGLLSSLTVHNISQQIVYKKESIDSQQFQFELFEPAGIYIIEVQTRTFSQRLKLIVE